MTIIWSGAHGKDLPQNNSIRPYIGFRGGLAIQDRFGRHPPDGEQLLSSSNLKNNQIIGHLTSFLFTPMPYSEIIGCVDISAHLKVRNFDEIDSGVSFRISPVKLINQAVATGQISVNVLLR